MTRYQGDEEFVRKKYGNRLSVVTGTGAFRYHDIWIDTDNPRKSKCIASARGRLRDAWEKAATYVRHQVAIRQSAKDTFQYLVKLKDAPCMDCGRKYPNYVMEFDHVRAQKKFNLSVGWQKHSISEIEEELEKCELVCANCHRVRTITRMRSKGKKKKGPGDS